MIRDAPRETYPFLCHVEEGKSCVYRMGGKCYHSVKHWSGAPCAVDVLRGCAEEPEETERVDSDR